MRVRRAYGPAQSVARFSAKSHQARPSECWTARLAAFGCSIQAMAANGSLAKPGSTRPGRRWLAPGGSDRADTGSRRDLDLRADLRSAESWRSRPVDQGALQKPARWGALRCRQLWADGDRHGAGELRHQSRAACPAA